MKPSFLLKMSWFLVEDGCCCFWDAGWAKLPLYRPFKFKDFWLWMLLFVDRTRLSDLKVGDLGPLSEFDSYFSSTIFLAFFLDFDFLCSVNNFFSYFGFSWTILFFIMKFLVYSAKEVASFINCIPELADYIELSL